MPCRTAALSTSSPARRMRIRPRSTSELYKSAWASSWLGHSIGRMEPGLWPAVIRKRPRPQSRFRMTPGEWPYRGDDHSLWTRRLADVGPDIGHLVQRHVLTFIDL